MSRRRYPCSVAPPWLILCPAGPCLRNSTKCVALVALLLPLVAGCGKEPDFQGKTFAQWAAQAHGDNVIDRRAAYVALASYTSSKKAYAALMDVIAGEETEPPDAFAAATELYRNRSDAADDLIAPIEAAIRRQADSPSLPQSVSELDGLIFWMGPKAKPWLTDLQYAASSAQLHKASSRQRLEALRKITESLAKF